METLKEGQNEHKAKGDLVTAEIDTAAEKINLTFTAKDKARDDYFHARYDYEVQRDLIYHVQNL